MIKCDFEDYLEVKEDCELYRNLARKYLALDLSDPNLCFDVKKKLGLWLSVGAILLVWRVK